MCEHGRRASHNEGHDGPNIRPRQLRNREVPWEGSFGSKLMSRRTERPYKVDGTGKLARHSAAPRSVPEINGPVVQREFTFLHRETCNRAPSETAGARVSNGPRAFAGVSRGRSTESNEPGADYRPVKTKRPDGLTTREGLNLIGSIDPGWTGAGADAEWPSRPRASGAETEYCDVLRDGQEPPDADPHVRWCGSRGSNPPGHPIRRTGSTHGVSACAGQPVPS